ncbi:MAG: hypothetical protein L6408_08780 [Nanoarchaeota archaeon]|nr:hypothetical protein [Nanoarchaeota archaeon]
MKNPKKRLISIPPRTTMRDRTGYSGSITDLPAKLLELQKRLTYINQEVEKAKERGEDVTPKLESGGCLNIGGQELDLNDISKSLNLGEGAQGLEKMLKIDGLGSLFKNLLENVEGLKTTMEGYQESTGGYGKSKSKGPVIQTNIKVNQLGQDPKEWTGLSGSGAPGVSDRTKGSGTTGSVYQKGQKPTSYTKKPSSSSSGIGGINKGTQRGLGEGSQGQIIEKKVKKRPAINPQKGIQLQNIVDQDIDYDMFPKGDNGYEMIVNGLGVEKVDKIDYDSRKNQLLKNGNLKIPLKDHKIGKVLDWEYRNNVLMIKLEK